MKKALKTSVTLLTLAFSTGLAPAYAQLDVNNVFMLRDFRGPNDIGTAAGDRLQYGGNILGGSLGGTVAAIYPPTGFSDPPGACGPLAINANFCSNSTAFNLNRTAQPWQITFSRGAESRTVTGPSLAGTDFRVPLVSAATITGSGTPTPTISWQLPSGYTPDAFRVQLQDRNVTTGSGTADVIFSAPLQNTATSFTLPGGVIQPGGNYRINLEVLELRDPSSNVTGNVNILTRSQTWYALAQLPQNGPESVFLPMIDATGMHSFANIPVTAGQMIFIDPEFATGWDYMTRPGDPNFASVMLPAGIGDNLFTLWLWNGTQWVNTGQILHGGTVFVFGAGGVDRFRITGIELSAMVDPFSPTAFPTGVSFAANGFFNGSMSPLVAAVPEPSTLALLFGGGLGLAGWLRRRKAVTDA